MPGIEEMVGGLLGARRSVVAVASLGALLSFSGSLFAPVSADLAPNSPPGEPAVGKRKQVEEPHGHTTHNTAELGSPSAGGVASVPATCHPLWRMELVASLTCRIEGWQSTSTMCQQFHELLVQECEAKSKRVSSETDMEYFFVTFQPQVDIPIWVDGTEVSKYSLSILANLKLEAATFCAMQEKVLVAHGVAEDLSSCEAKALEHFQKVTNRREADLSPHAAEKLPRTLHQTWKSRIVPKRFRRWATSWRNNHRAWNFRMWSDEDNRELVETSFPELLSFYDSLRHTILRVDLIRYMILYTHGGIYADLDVESLKSLDPLLEDRHMRVLLGTESETRNTIDISVMGSVPKHPIWLKMIRAAVIADGVSYVNDVLQITGNRLFTQVVHRSLSMSRSRSYGMHGGIIILRSPLLYPDIHAEPTYRMTKNRQFPCGTNASAPDNYSSCARMFPNSYIVHHETGTWVKSFWSMQAQSSPSP